MVGNDVVDLRDPEARPATLHPRFDERVFTASERAWLHGSSEPMRERWRLWASKEAAYKLARRRDAKTVFSPRRFETRVAPDASCKVTHRCGREGECNSGTCCARFDVHFADEADKTAVHAVAVAEGSHPPLVVRQRRLSADEPDARDPYGPSRAVRRLCAEHLAPLLGCRSDALELRREGRIPRLFWRGRVLPMDLSLSHHGGLVAFACALARD